MSNAKPTASRANKSTTGALSRAREARASNTQWHGTVTLEVANTVHRTAPPSRAASVPRRAAASRRAAPRRAAPVRRCAAESGHCAAEPSRRAADASHRREPPSRRSPWSDTEMTKAAEPSQAAELALQQAWSRRRAAAIRRAVALRCAQNMRAWSHECYRKTPVLVASSAEWRGERHDQALSDGGLEKLPYQQFIRDLVLYRSLHSTNLGWSRATCSLQLGTAGLDCSTCGSDIQLASDSRIGPAIGMMSRAASQRASGFRRAEKPVAGAVRLTSN